MACKHAYTSALSKLVRALVLVVGDVVELLTTGHLALHTGCNLSMSCPWGIPACHGPGESQHVMPLGDPSMSWPWAIPACPNMALTDLGIGSAIVKIPLAS